MKKDAQPLIVAIFLAVIGLGSQPFISAVGRVAGTVFPSRNGDFFISTAQGAENVAAFFSAHQRLPISAVSGEETFNERSVFFTTSGAIKDPGIFSGATIR